MSDETYVGGLRDLLGDFRPRALLILDEAHHAAPASGSRYAVDSQFTRAIRGLADRFEHRLFLSATPHNGHSQFVLRAAGDPRSAALHQRRPGQAARTRSGHGAAAEVRPALFRREVSRAEGRGVRHQGPAERRAGTPAVAHARRTMARRCAAKAANMGAREAGLLRLVVRRPSTAPAVVDRRLRQDAGGASEGASPRRTQRPRRRWRRRSSKAEPSPRTSPDDPSAGERFIADRGDRGRRGGRRARPRASRTSRWSTRCWRSPASTPSSRTRAFASSASWIRRHMTSDGRWNDRRLVLFTEYEDTRRWLEVQLAEALDDLAPDDRIAVFTGATSTERREELKRRFNSDPAADPLRILICTDAAREGINLQMRCHDLIHVDLPWNPARLEQRNGRIDRKLQPSPQVWCRYFVYEQRPEDVVLQALVRKTERIREQLGSAGQVISQRLSRTARARRHLARRGAGARDRRGLRRAARKDGRRRNGRRDRGPASASGEGAGRAARAARGVARARRRRSRHAGKGRRRGDVARGASLEAARAGEINGVALFRLDPNGQVEPWKRRSRNFCGFLCRGIGACPPLPDGSLRRSRGHHVHANLALCARSAAMDRAIETSPPFVAA